MKERIRKQKKYEGRIERTLRADSWRGNHPARNPSQQIYHNVGERLAAVTLLQCIKSNGQRWGGYLLLNRRRFPTVGGGGCLLLDRRLLSSVGGGVGSWPVVAYSRSDS